MTEPISEFSAVISSHNAGVWGKAPEVEAARKTEPELPPPVDADTFIGALAEANEMRERAEIAEAGTSLLADRLIDGLAATDVDDLVLSGQAEDVADTLVEAAGVDDWRTQGFLEDWSQRDPVAANQWVDAQLADAQAAQVRAEADVARAELVARQREANAAVERAVPEFFERNPVAREALDRAPGFAQLMTGIVTEVRAENPAAFAPAHIDQTMRTIFEYAAGFNNATNQVQAVYELRSAFAKTSFADAKAGRVKTQPAPPTLEDTFARMPASPQDRAVQRQENDARFREAFRTTASSPGRTFGEDMRKLAAKDYEAAARARIERGIRTGRR